MKHNYSTFILFFVFPIILFSQQKDGIRVFYLGGQSNMVGYGFNKDLPSDLNKEFNNVFIYAGNPAGDNKSNGGLGKWNKLKPGFGVGFSSDGIKNNYSKDFLKTSYYSNEFSSKHNHLEFFFSNNLNGSKASTSVISLA